MMRLRKESVWTERRTMVVSFGSTDCNRGSVEFKFLPVYEQVDLESEAQDSPRNAPGVEVTV